MVVTKRIQQRFFLKQGSRLTNPPPGTIVDTKVTRDELFDFFLVPQSVGQGTVTPTHYNVLEFQTTLKPDHIQRIAYKLCHIYFNWTVSFLHALFCLDICIGKLGAISHRQTC